VGPTHLEKPSELKVRRGEEKGRDHNRRKNRCQGRGEGVGGRGVFDKTIQEAEEEV